MTINFDNIHSQHIDLTNKRWGSHVESKIKSVVVEAQDLLKEVRLAGRDVFDPNERQRLQSYALYWGSFIYEETGNYLNTNLDLSTEAIVSDSESLPESAKVVFYGLGAFAPEPEKFSLEAAQKVTGISDIDLQQLVGNKFVGLIGEELFVPVAVANIALKRLDKNAVIRHRDYYWELVNTNRTNWPLVDSFYGQIKKAWQSLPETAALLDWIWIVYLYQRDRSLWSDSIKWLERGLKLTTTDDLQWEKARLLDYLALAKVNLDQEREAVEDYQNALAIWQEIGNLAEEAAALTNIGRIYGNLNEPRKALTYYEKAEPILEKRGNQTSLAVLCKDMGIIHKELEQWASALNYFKRSLRVFKEIDDEEMLIEIYANIGAFSEQLGKWQEAYKAFTVLDKLQEKIGDVIGRAETLNSLANIHLNLRQEEAAIQQYELALEIQEEAEDADGQVNTLLNLGAYYRKADNMPQAIKYYRDALKLQDTIDDWAGQAKTLNVMGHIYHITGQLKKSLGNYEKALQVREEVGDKTGQAITLRNLGRLYGDLVKQSSDLGKQEASLAYYQQALNHYQQALKIYRENKDFNRSIIIINDMGMFFYALGQHKQALEHYELVLSETGKKDPSNPMRPRALFNIAMIHRDMGRGKATVKALQQAVEEARSINHPHWKAFEIELEEELKAQR